MIKSFKHKGLEAFFCRGDSSGLNQKHIARIRRILATIDAAVQKSDINKPGLRLHDYKGSRAGISSVDVSGNFRITFRFENGDAHILNYEDPH